MVKKIMVKKIKKSKVANKTAKKSKVKDLLLKKESVWKTITSKKEKEIHSFSENYKQFLGVSKTERLCAQNVVEELKKNGFKDITTCQKLVTGDKIYKFFKEKVVLAAIVGKKKDEWQLLCSHLDSPRLDLKPNPLYEDSDLALLQSHYYGGIKKYHWVNIPLAIHGVIHTKKGKKIVVDIGEKDDEPKVIISDLLPHLARTQMKKTADKVVEGEELNIIVGNKPLDDKDKELKEFVKLNTLKILNDEYGLEEEDLSFAELELVPIGKPVDIGFDKSMIGAYGQDDKVCVYTTLKAMIDCKLTKKTAVAFFADKEEIGSVGDTGAQSFVLQTFAQEYLEKTALKLTSGALFENSKAISADVTVALNPTYKDVSDPKNCALLGKGVSIDKYTGSGGKFMSNDASAEFMNQVRQIFIKNKIVHQHSELGKIDVGGGGTIAMFLSRFGMSCVDVGPAVLGMHSPCEITSKADIYEAYLFYKAFIE